MPLLRTPKTIKKIKRKGPYEPYMDSRTLCEAAIDLL